MCLTCYDYYDQIRLIRAFSACVALNTLFVDLIPSSVCGPVYLHEYLLFATRPVGRDKVAVLPIGFYPRLLFRLFSLSFTQSASPRCLPFEAALFHGVSQFTSFVVLSPSSLLFWLSLLRLFLLFCCFTGFVVFLEFIIC